MSSVPLPQSSYAGIHPGVASSPHVQGGGGGREGGGGFNPPSMHSASATDYSLFGAAGSITAVSSFDYSSSMLGLSALHMLSSLFDDSPTSRHH